MDPNVAGAMRMAAATRSVIVFATKSVEFAVPWSTLESVGRPHTTPNVRVGPRAGFGHIPLHDRSSTFGPCTTSQQRAFKRCVFSHAR